MNRREFLENAFALAAVSGPIPLAGAAELLGDDLDLRLGVVSDIHVNISPGAKTSAAAERFRHALTYFRDRDVDAVLIPGDLTDTGLQDEFELMARMWNEVFPGGRGKNGKRVVNLMHYGDHDAEKRFYRLDRLTPRYAKAGLPVPPSLSEGNLRKTLWEKCFGEPWSPIRVVQVKGYTFVLSNFMRENPGSAKGLDKVLKGLNLDPEKPFFFSQHRWIRGTYLADQGMGHCSDAGRNGPVLANYPNVVAFTGHTHYMLADGRNVWQEGPYTVINAASLAYAPCGYAHENGIDFSWVKNDPARDAQMPCIDIHQGHDGMIFNLKGDNVVLERRDFGVDEPIGPDLVFTLKPTSRQKDYTLAKCRAASKAPQFPAKASIALSSGLGKNRKKQPVEQVKLTFPVANPTATSPRAYDYVVRALDANGKILCEKRVFSPSIMMPPSHDLGPVNCVFAKTEVADAATFTVAPANEWRVEGAAISAPCEVRS